MENFIEPKKDISNTNSSEWAHFANLDRTVIRNRWESPSGKGLLATLRKERFSKDILEEKIGKLGGKFDLRGIPMNGYDASNQDFSEIDFFYANFSKSNLYNTNFLDSHLSEVSIKGAKMHWTRLNKNTLLDNLEFDSKTEVIGLDFNNANLTMAEFLKDLADSYSRIQQLKRYYPIIACLLWLTCDYGRSFSRYMLWVVAFIFIFAGLYWRFSGGSFVQWSYFSLETFLTAGYGFLTIESNLVRILASLEMFIGYMMGGLLIALLAKKLIG